MNHTKVTHNGIPKWMRVLLIVHLCFVFTLLAWEGIYAFSKESLSKKSKIELFQFALAHTPHEANQTFFSELSDSEKTYLTRSYENLLEEKGSTLLQKIISIAYAWCYELSPWFQAWIFFSLLSAFLILFRIKGMRAAIWVLPITILGYAYFHHIQAPLIEPPTSTLIPSESEITNKYLDHPLREAIADQKKDLEFAWKHYLIDRWSHEKASQDPNIFLTQAQRGYYFFIIANIRSDSPQTFDTFTSPMFLRAPLLLVALYFLWNVLFASLMSRKVYEKGQK